MYIMTAYWKDVYRMVQLVRWDELVSILHWNTDQKCHTRDGRDQIE